MFMWVALHPRPPPRSLRAGRVPGGPELLYVIAVVARYGLRPRLRVQIGIFRPSQLHTGTERSDRESSILHINPDFLACLSLNCIST